MENGCYKMEDLIPVVSDLAGEYTGLDHSSISYERAQELMEAVLYCIREYECSGKNTLASFGVSPKGAYLCGREIVKEKFIKLQNVYGEIIKEFEDFGVACLRDVVEDGISEFIRRYDIKFAPHETLLTLDYPILKNIQKMSGVDAVLAYAEGIYMEQQFLKQFDISYVVEALRCYYEEYEGLLENVCGIVILNVIGHLILGKPLSEKGFQSNEYVKIEQILQNKTEAQTRQFLEAALKNLIESHFRGEMRLYDYFCCMVLDWEKRIRHHAMYHSLEKIFLI